MFGSGSLPLGLFKNLLGDSVRVRYRLQSGAVAVSLCISTHYVRFPVQPAELNPVRQLFDQIAGFPNVTGRVDGTHIRIIATSARLCGRETLHTPGANASSLG